MLTSTRLGVWWAQHHQRNRFLYLNCSEASARMPGPGLRTLGQPCSINITEAGSLAVQAAKSTADRVFVAARALWFDKQCDDGWVQMPQTVLQFDNFDLDIWCSQFVRELPLSATTICSGAI